MTHLTFRPSRGFILLASLFAGVAAQANPADTPTKGYARQLYVDSKASCLLPAACGSVSAPFKNLREALSTVTPGTEVVVAGYTDAAYYNTDNGLPGPDRFAAQHFLMLPKLELNGSPAATGSNQAATLIRGWKGMAKPVVRGTMRFNGWQAVGGVSNLYVLPWNIVGQGLATQDANGQYVYPVVPPQQVYRGSKGLEQVGGLLYNAKTYDPDASFWPTRTATRKVGRITPVGDQPWLNLAANQFYYDHATRNLYVKLDAPLVGDEVLEASVQQFLVSTYKVNNLTIKDLVLERSNGSSYSPQNSAVNLGGNNVVLDGIAVQDVDAIGLGLGGTKISLLNSRVVRSGQMGLSAAGSDMTFSGNTFEYNNAKGFNEWWAAAAIKLIGNGALKNSTISKNVVKNTYGHGIWLDTDPVNITIDNNVVAYSGEGGTGGIGIFLEATSGHKVTNNKVVANGAHGIQMEGGGNTITGNLIVANGLPGIAHLPDVRIDKWTAHTINTNTLAWNHDVVPGSNAGYAIQLLSGRAVMPVNAPAGSAATVSGAASKVSFNKYCGARPYWAMDSTSYFTLPTWQKQGGSTTVVDAFSSSRTVAYPYSASAATPELGNYVERRDPIVVTAAIDGTLATYVSQRCR